MTNGAFLQNSRPVAPGLRLKGNMVGFALLQLRLIVNDLSIARYHGRDKVFPLLGTEIGALFALNFVLSAGGGASHAAGSVPAAAQSFNCSLSLRFRIKRCR